MKPTIINLIENDHGVTLLQDMQKKNTDHHPMTNLPPKNGGSLMISMIQDMTGRLYMFSLHPIIHTIVLVVKF